MTDITPSDKAMGIKLQIDVLLAEFKIWRDLLNTHKGMQGGLDTVALAGWFPSARVDSRMKAGFWWWMS